MRSPRSCVLSPWGKKQSASYHIISRVVDRQFVLQRQEKEEFVRLMRLYEKFCGVRVLTYCVMTNHFHILLEVPPKPEEEMSDDALIAKLSVIYSEGYVSQIVLLLSAARALGAEEEVERIRNTYLYRMYDLSQFMKVLKQRFTQWYNRKHGRTETLWESRFKSVLVEDGYAAMVMAAYIDLNPVRAGMVKDPKEYRWCGYGEAIAGRRRAKAGIAAVLVKNEESIGQSARNQTQGERLAAYRMFMFEEAHVVEGSKRKGISTKTVQKELKNGGKLTRTQMLHCRVRYFSDGAVIGSKAYVDAYFEQKRAQFSEKRTSGARKLKHMAEGGLYALRDLQRRPVG
ncbi:transposase [Rubritalea sp.]|uniref:transposase n=1 Tax=Rubritalea sp. TaxID=2109375 RepID=UPI003EF5BC63